MRKGTALMAIAMLGGCGQGGDGGNGSAAVPGAAGGNSSAAALQPGMWEATARFTTLDAPSLPPEVAAALRAAISLPQTRTGCLTPERIADPTGALAAVEAAANASCRFPPNGFAGGRINLRGACSGPDGDMQVTVDGSYSATTMEATIGRQIAVAPNRPGSQSIRFEGRMTARRTGECPARIVDNNSVG